MCLCALRRVLACGRVRPDIALECRRVIMESQALAVVCPLSMSLMHSMICLSLTFSSGLASIYEGVLQLDEQLWFLPTRIPREEWMLFVEVDKWFILRGWEFHCWLIFLLLLCLFAELLLEWELLFSPNICRSWQIHSKIHTILHFEYRCCSHTYIFIFWHLYMKRK